MIPRYTRPEMGRIWSDENKFRQWLEVEIATAEAEAEAGLIPRSAARAIRRKGRFSVERILEIEKKVKHDVIAFTTNVAQNIGREGRYLHYGLTSNDVVDTAQALQVREAPDALHRATMAVAASSLEKSALEVRNLQRTEVGEVEEYFTAAQKGSSAMPHKRSPVTAEQIGGLARVVRANAQAALENVALWHERDISHSSVERIVLPDSTILLDTMLDKTATLVETLNVYPE